MKSQLFPVLGILTLLVLFSCEKGKTTDPEAGKTVSSVTYTSATSDYKNELSFEYDTQGRIVKIILGLPSQTVTTSVEYDNGKVTERTVSSMDDSDFYTDPSIPWITTEEQFLAISRPSMIFPAKIWQSVP